MGRLLKSRFYRALASIYLYNEQRGHSQLKLLHEAFVRQFPQQTDTAAAIWKHSEDERRHGLMFQAYLTRRGFEPLWVGPRLGYIDLLVATVFGRSLEELHADQILKRPADLMKLCRLIQITEERGLKQVRWLLAHPWIRQEPELVRIFRIIERDEPSHFEPYEAWLKDLGEGSQCADLVARAADVWIHWSIFLFRFPWFVLWARRTSLGSAVCA